MFRFPFTNFHELNLDWILSVVKEAKEVFDSGREDIDYAVQTAEDAKTIAQQAAEATIPDGAVTTIKIANKAVTAPKLADGLIVHDNLLENWYFVGGGSQLGEGYLPINQRNQSVYNNAGFCIDRWSISTGLELTLNNNYVTLNNTNANRQILTQLLSEPFEILGKTLVASAIIDGVLHSGFTVIPAEFPSSPTFYNLFSFDSNDARIELRADGSARFEFVVKANTSVMISAFKLEIGDVQSLGYYKNGALVLNNIPDYTTELLKCQRYYVTTIGFFVGFGASTETFMCFVPLPVKMVKAPTVTVPSSFGYFRQDSSHVVTSIDDTSVVYSNGVRISGTGTGIENGKVGVITGTQFNFSAE